ncbi:MAG: TCR/Tet family MFS transporter [Pseudohongiellaceae bacterium]
MTSGMETGAGTDGKAGTKSRALVFIILVVLIDAIGFGIILPVLPKLIIGLTGTDLEGAARLGGWLMFSFALMQFFFAPVMGNLGDAFGRRPILLFALLALGLDYLLMAFAPTIIWLFVGRLIAGVAGSTFSIAYAYITDTTPVEKRAQAFGMVGAAFGGGFILGPVIGGLLGEFGERLPFYAAATLALINVVYGYFVLGESLAKVDRRPFELRRANPAGAILQLKKYPLVLGLAIAYFLYMLGHLSLPSTWTYYTMEKFAWSESQIGYSLGFAGVFMILVQAFLIRWAIPRFGAFRSGLIGMAAMILGFCGYAFTQVGWQLYIWLAIASISGFVSPALQSIMTSHIPRNAQGELQGALTSMNSITSILGPVMMTQLFAAFTAETAAIYFPGVSFFMAAVLTAVCLLIFIIVVARIGLAIPKTHGET